MAIKPGDVVMLTRSYFDWSEGRVRLSGQLGLCAATLGVETHEYAMVSFGTVSFGGMTFVHTIPVRPEMLESLGAL